MTGLGLIRECYVDNEYCSYACTFTDDSIVWTAWLMRDTPPA